jgi:hypothetical protein
MQRVRPAAVLAVLASACATLGTPAGSDDNLPSSGVGPFRPVTEQEVPSGALAPFVFSSEQVLYREPAVLAASGDPSSASVILYAVGRVGGRDVIVRTRADDGRSFYGDVADNANDTHPLHAAPQVLAADQPWEGANLAGPSAVQVGTQTWLYYGAAGGIGLAQSSDGATFTKAPGPVLGADPGAAWESTPPGAPSVAVFPDGSWHMAYSAGASIGEAVSADGVSWARFDADPTTPALDPILGPGGSGSFDSAQVSDPLLAPRVTPAGRLHVRVLYTGWDGPPGAASRSSAIGFAARYGASGPLTRAGAPVYTVSLHEAAPALFEWAAGSMLYVHEDDGVLDRTHPYSAVAAAFAPEEGMLPPVGPFPPGP